MTEDVLQAMGDAENALSGLGYPSCALPSGVSGTRVDEISDSVDGCVTTTTTTTTQTPKTITATPITTAAPTTTQTPTAAPPTAAILGIVFGFLVVVGIVFLWWRRRQFAKNVGT